MNDSPQLPPRSPLRFVLVRGLARAAEHWHGFDRVLAERFPGSKVECHDLAGNGEQWRRRTPLRIEAIAADLRARVWAADHSPAIVVAISLGAMVSLAWLQRWPDDPLRGLVAINTSVGGLCRPWQRMQPRGLVHTLRALADPDPVARELKILDLTTSRHRRNRELARVQAGVHAQKPIARANVLRQIIAGAGFRARGPLPVPMLLLNSRADRLVDPACSRVIAERFGASLAIHPTAGHDLSLDDPQWCAARIAQWLSGNVGVTARSRA